MKNKKENKINETTQLNIRPETKKAFLKLQMELSPIYFGSTTGKKLTQNSLIKLMITLTKTTTKNRISLISKNIK